MSLIGSMTLSRISGNKFAYLPAPVFVADLLAESVVSEQCLKFSFTKFLFFLKVFLREDHFGKAFNCVVRLS